MVTGPDLPIRIESAIWACDPGRLLLTNGQRVEVARGDLVLYRETNNGMAVIEVVRRLAIN